MDPTRALGIPTGNGHQHMPAILSLRRLVTDLLWEGRLLWSRQSGGNCTSSSPQGHWYLWPRPEGIAGDGPMAQTPPYPPGQGTRTGRSGRLHTFLKYLFPEKLKPRLTAQKRALTVPVSGLPSPHCCLACVRNWEHTTVWHPIFFT